jgi:hypothetical protein
MALVGWGLGIKPMLRSSRILLQRFALCVLLFVVLASDLGLAQTCVSDLEPNQTPNEATPFSGSGCLTGTISVDNQDLYVWTLTAQDVGDKALAFDFESVAGALSSMFLVRVELNEEGLAKSREDLLKLTTNDGAKVSKEYGQLEPGTYYLGVALAGEGEGAYTVNIRLVEPTNVVAEAAPLGDSLGAKGTFPENGKAVFSFTTTEPELFRVQTLGDGVQSLEYYDQGGAKLTEASGALPLRLDNLALPAGTHYLKLTGTDDYILKVVSQGPVPAGTALLSPETPVLSDISGLELQTDTSTLAETQTAESAEDSGPSIDTTSCVSEVEPNNNSDEATALAKLGCFSGQLSNEDSVDFYTLTIDEATSQKLLDLEFVFSGDTDVTVYLKNSEETDLQYRYFRGQGVLPDLTFKPGKYRLVLSGYADPPIDYQVKVVERGSPEAGVEQEPNDYPVGASSTASDNTLKGRMVGDDTDVFRLTVEGEPQLWQLQATGKGLNWLSFYDGSGREIQRRSSVGSGKVQLSNVYLLPGTNYVALNGRDASYTFRAIPLGPPDAADASRPSGENERESNDDQTRAQTIRFNEPRVGLLAEIDDIDTYRFTLYAPETVRLEVTPGKGGAVGAQIDGVGEYYNPETDKINVVEAEFLPGDHYITLTSRSSEPIDSYYQLVLKRAEPVTTSSDIVLTLTTDTPELAAYWYQGQVVDAMLTLENKSSVTKQLELSATTSHYAWRASLEQTSISLSANQTQTVLVKLEVLADARDDQSVLLSVQARDGSDSVTAGLEVSALCAVPPINEQLLYAVPDPLLGRFNVAWTGLGATLVGEPMNGSETLFDGLVSPATGWRAQAGESVTVQLTGDEPLDIAGLLLNPQSNTYTLDEQLKDFEIYVSLDGATFEKVFSGSLSAAPTEQSVVFEQSVKARFMQLKVLSAYREDPYSIGLGEFKVIAAPTSQEVGVSGLNIADPNMGGYIVWSTPLLGDAYGLLTEDEYSDSLYLEENQKEFTFVLGFHNDRAARLTEVQLKPSADSSYLGLENLDVSISLESPIGPWTSLGTWQTAQALVLGEPTWVRFIKFTAKNLDPAQGYVLPDALRVLEQPSDDEYLSIVGEWGQSQRTAIYEKLVPRVDTNVIQETDNNETKENAQPLTVGQPLSGQVVINEDVDWYKITVPASDNTLELTMTGDPAVRATFELQDAQGKPVNVEQSGSASEVKLLATVEPGEYFLKLEEPPRSVVFTWDNSGSMGNYTDIIYQSVSNFVQDVQEGREVVQLLPFTDLEDGKFLLEEWSGDPYELMAALNNYDRIDSSSSAETNLWAATKALGQRAGTRAVMLMTDAESSSYPLTSQLWQSLEKVQPRVFSFETSSAGSYYSQDLMQSWADVAGGFYDYARSIGEFDIGFARATCHLRRPAQYQLSVATRNEAPPGPGQLSVTRANEAEAANLPGVEIILDSSGSMYQKLGDESRIGIAKDVLSELVTNVIPEGTPFALRIFGHKEPKSCRTDLDVPLGPLEPASVLDIIAEVDPKMLSGTPIAESLNQVASDLQGATGPKTVVLLTDGEESCDGDVEAAIENLKAQGIAFQLNVVAFADSEESAKEQFRNWAKLGGGVYLEGGNNEELKNAMTQTLNPAFEVMDAKGSLVASGQVGGEAVSVPAGVYTVKIATGEIFQNVRVLGEESVMLELGGSQ